MKKYMICLMVTLFLLKIKGSDAQKHYFNQAKAGKISLESTNWLSDLSINAKKTSEINFSKISLCPGVLLCSRVPLKDWVRNWPHSLQPMSKSMLHQIGITQFGLEELSYNPYPHFKTSGSLKMSTVSLDHPSFIKNDYIHSLNILCFIIWS